MGIATGQMPNVDLIWSVQQAEGRRMCFGQALNCQDRTCRWRGECVALDFFAEIPLVSLLHVSKDPKSKITSSTERKPSKGYIVDREPASAGALEPAGIGSDGS